MPLDPSHRRYRPAPSTTRLMLAYLLRVEEAFNAVREGLTPEHLASVDVPCSVVWLVARELYEACGFLSEQVILEVELLEKAAANPSLLDAVGLEDARKVLEWAFSDEVPIRNPHTAALWAKSKADALIAWSQQPGD